MEAQFSTDRKKKNIGYMISLVSAAVNGHQPVEPTDDINFGIVYKFLKLHTLANTAFYAVEKLEHKPETELLKKWRDERNMGVHKNMIQTLEFAAFTDALKQNKIEYMPIKGFPLCELYPKPDYRMMSDVDVVVREKDMKKGGEIILGLGYSPVMVGSIHHDEYNKPPFMIIELHHDMVARDSRFFKYYEGIMDRAEKVGDYERKLSDEDFFIFVLVHLNKHFEDSGTGIRSLLDLHLLNEKSLPKLDREYVFSELEKLGHSVKFHATTRSPIEVSLNEKYPLHRRFPLQSLYDPERRTFIYDLAGYDLAVIVTDAPEVSREGLESLTGALEACGNDNIILIKWSDNDR